jgi:hypothetical protein
VSSSHRRSVVLVAALASVAGAVAPSGASAIYCPVAWPVVANQPLVDVKSDGAPAPYTTYTRTRFGRLVISRKPKTRRICAEVTLRSGVRMRDLQIVSGGRSFTQRNGATFLDHRVPGASRRFRVDVFVTLGNGRFGDDSVRASL